MLDGSQHKDDFREIKMITCSSYHSVFGFLLSMGYHEEFIRNEMFHLRYVAGTMENQKEVEKYLDSYAWLNNTQATSKKLL